MSSNPDQSDAQASHPFVSLWLLVHLFVVFLALTSNYAPSLLQGRVLGLMRPYSQLLNIDLNYTPYHLTHATIDDVDHRIEVLPDGKDPAVDENWIVLPDIGYRGGESYQRYQRLAEIMSVLSEQEEAVGRLAKSVAEQFLNQRGIKPKQIRVRRHMLQSSDVIGGGTPPQRDPNNPMYFQVVYAANTIITGDRVDIIKISSAGEVARPDAGGTPSQ